MWASSWVCGHLLFVFPGLPEQKEQIRKPEPAVSDGRSCAAFTRPLSRGSIAVQLCLVSYIYYTYTLQKLLQRSFSGIAPPRSPALRGEMLLVLAWGEAWCECRQPATMGVGSRRSCCWEPSPSVLRAGGLCISHGRSCTTLGWRQLSTEVHARAGGGSRRCLGDLVFEILLGSDSSGRLTPVSVVVRIR